MYEPAREQFLSPVVAFNLCAFQMFDVWATQVNRFNTLASLPASIEQAYRKAEAEEEAHAALQSNIVAEPMPDFSIIEKRYPDIAITSEIPEQFPFTRIWTFDRRLNTENPVCIVNAANSGKTSETATGSALSCLGMGSKTLLVQYRDPRYVEEEYAVTLDSSSSALAFVARRHPGCLLDGTSQGGLVATLAAAKAPDDIAGLIVSGSPIHPKAGNSVTSLMAQYSLASPRYIKTRGDYPGRGRSVLPGDAMDVLYRDAVGETCGHSHVQHLPAELIGSVLEWYGGSPARNPIADLSKIKCPIVIVTATDDKIVAPRETNALAELTPHAPHTKISIPGGHYDLLEEETRKAFVMPAVTQITAKTGARLMRYAS